MNRSLLALPIALIFGLPAEAFLPGRLTKEEEQTCQRRAARSKNSFSAKQTYYECKRTIKKENENKIKRQKWRSCYERELKSNEIASAEKYENIKLKRAKRRAEEIIKMKDKKNNKVISEHPRRQPEAPQMPVETDGTWRNPGGSIDEFLESKNKEGGEIWYEIKFDTLRKKNELLAKKACEKYD